MSQQRLLSAEVSIKVVCRIRPLLEVEEEAGLLPIVEINEEDNKVSVRENGYVFDEVFTPNSSEEDVYNGVTKRMLKDIFSGYNATVIAYGQTSSGKTYTMEAITSRIATEIFERISAMDENWRVNVKMSYVEIYMDKILDLLNGKGPLDLNLDGNGVPYVYGATQLEVVNSEQLFKAVEKGKSRRHTAKTNMNSESSRSHSLLYISVQREDLNNQLKLSGKLCLVDLAGWENSSKTGAAGLVQQEGSEINLSLIALGKVITALSEGNKSHIPYQDCRLTRILQDSLGGNTRTTIIICSAPASSNEGEIKSALQFGTGAKAVKNVVSVYENLNKDDWRKKYLKMEMKYKQLLASVDPSTATSPDEPSKKIPRWAEEKIERQNQENAALRNMNEALQAQIAALRRERGAGPSNAPTLEEALEQERAASRMEMERLGQMNAALVDENELLHEEILQKDQRLKLNTKELDTVCQCRQALRKQLRPDERADEGAHAAEVVDAVGAEQAVPVEAVVRAEDVGEGNEGEVVRAQPDVNPGD